jgi:hypothetical protein
VKNNISRKRWKEELKLGWHVSDCPYAPSLQSEKINMEKKQTQTKPKRKGKRQGITAGVSAPSRAY